MSFNNKMYRVRYAKVDTLLSTLEVSLSLLSNVPKLRTRQVANLRAPAATDWDFEGYPTVMYDAGAMPPISKDNLAIWLGASWHELGHILFTPPEYVGAWSMALNILEDHRIEQLVIKKFPRLEGALKAMLLYFFADSDVPVNGNYIYALIAGRSMISDAIRLKARAHALDADKIDDIVSEYVSLGHPLSRVARNKGQTLAHKLEALIGIHGNPPERFNKTKSVDDGEQIELDDPTPNSGSDNNESNDTDDSADRKSVV